MRLLGLDPGLQRTGWGIIEVSGTHLGFIAAGVVATSKGGSLAERLMELHAGIDEIVKVHRPEEAAVEETFVNKNPTSTLKLGQARGIAMLVPAQRGLAVAEYPPNLVKKTVVGNGHATKEQVQMMVGTLLPGSREGLASDAADALAVAICHAHHRQTSDRIAIAIRKVTDKISGDAA